MKEIIMKQRKSTLNENISKRKLNLVKEVNRNKFTKDKHTNRNKEIETENIFIKQIYIAAIYSTVNNI